MEKTESVKQVHFDVIRGLAALVVVVCHIHIAFNIKNSSFGFSDVISYIVNPIHTFFFGEFAVCLFFVLSGFVLSIGYFKTFDKLLILKLALKRLPRLFIPVLVTSFLYWLALKYGWFYKQEVLTITHSTWLVQFWSRVYNIADFFKHVIFDLFILNDQQFCLDLNKCLWTMPIEFHYSYLLFISLLFIINTKTLIIFNCILLLSFLVKDQHFYFLAFGIGLNIAYFYAMCKINLTNFMSFFALMLAFVLGTNIFGHFWGNEVFFCMGAGFLLSSVTFNAKWASFISNSFFIFIGKISFSLYLIHLLVLGTFSSLLFVKMIEWHIDFELVYLAVFLFTLTVSILCAIIVYYTVEKPSLKLAGIFSDIILSKLKVK